MHFGVWLGHGRQQRLGVGMQWFGIKRLTWGELDDLAQIHHRHPGRDVAHHGQIVGNEQVCQAIFFLQVFQQVHDLRLNRDVQRCNWFVANNKFRVQSQCARDADALALATRKRMRIATREFTVKANLIHQIMNFVALFIL